MGAPVPAPTLFLPENENFTNDNTPIFSWDNELPADNFYIQIDNNEDFGSPEYENSELTENTYTLQWEYSLPDGQYYWHARMMRDEVMSNWSENRLFSIDTTPPLVIGVTPPSGATGVSVDENVIVVFDNPIDTSFAPGITQTAGIDPGGWSGPVWSTTTHENDTATWTHSNWTSSDAVALLLENFKDNVGNDNTSVHAWSFNITSYSWQAVDMWTGTLNAIATYYVNQEGMDTNDGLSWDTAKSTIENAIVTAVDGDTIIVGDGIYTENLDVDKSLTIMSENGPLVTIIRTLYASDRVFEVLDNSVTIGGFTIENATGVSAVYLSAVENCRVENNIVGINSNGIFLSQSRNNVIENNIIENNSAYGIYLSYSDNNEVSNNHLDNNENCAITINSSDTIIVFGNTIENNGQGIYLVDSENSNIYNNTLDHHPSDGIVLETSDNNTVENNTIENNTSSGNGIYINNSDSNVILSNVLDNNRRGIYIYNSENNTISGNTADNSFYSGAIELYQSNNNTVENNTARSSESGINLTSSDNNTVENNVMENNVVGITLLFWSDNNLIFGNTVENSGTGINLENSDNNTLSGNTVENSSTYGILLYNDSDNNTLSGNTINNDSEFGGIEIDGSDNNTIESNVVENNSLEHGIYLYDSHGNLISGNTTGSNLGGICIDSSSSNEIENNIIRSNENGVYSTGSSSNNYVRNNNIVNNTGYGVFNEGSQTLSAENNWWGSSTGPGGSGPGRGDAVGGDVDYNPWLPTPFEGGTWYPDDYWSGTVGTITPPWQTEETWTETITTTAGWSIAERWVDNMSTTAVWQAVESWVETIVAPVNPTQPELISPENNAYTDNTPIFQWTIATYAENHRIEIDNDADFSSPLDNTDLDNTTDNWTVSSEYPEDNYYWRVWAVNQWGENVSENRHFETISGLLPGEPVLVSPENQANVRLTVTFEWQIDPYADNHRIEIDNDEDFSSPVENTSISSPENTYTTTLPSYAIYYWRVWSVNVLGENVSENTWQFTVMAAWDVVESWTCTVNPTPAYWRAVESWTGTVNNVTYWRMVETWTGTIGVTSSSWQAVETWTGTIGVTSSSWQAVETWTGTISPTAAYWRAVETWAETLQATSPSSPPSTPSLTSTLISVSPSSFELTSGGSRTLTATLSADNSGLSGKTLTWSVASGSLSENSGTTDNSGQVTVTYTAPTVDNQTSVTVTVSFASDNSYSSSTGSSTGTISPAPVAAATSTSLTISPSSFLVASENSVTLTATLLNENGAALPDKTVGWSAAYGTLSAASGITDNAGQLSVTYTAPAFENQASVSVTASFAADNQYSASSATSSGAVLVQEKITEIENAVDNMMETMDNLNITLENDQLQFLENAFVEEKLGMIIDIRTTGTATGLTSEASLSYKHGDITYTVTVTVGEKVEMTLDSATENGKTIIFNIDNSALPNPDEFTVHYDNQQIGPADNYEDVLDPTNENVPEYLILIGGNGVQILISIPSFSSHTITISTLPTQPYATLPPTYIAVIVAIAFVIVLIVVIWRYVALGTKRLGSHPTHQKTSKPRASTTILILPINARFP